MISTPYSSVQCSLSNQAAGNLMCLPLSPMSALQATIEHSSQLCRLILIDIFIRYDPITNKTFPHSASQITQYYD
jgi:hypothetical protein